MYRDSRTGLGGYLLASGRLQLRPLARFLDLSWTFPGPFLDLSWTFSGRSLASSLHSPARRRARSDAGTPCARARQRVPSTREYPRVPESTREYPRVPETRHALRASKTAHHKRGPAAGLAGRIAPAASPPAEGGAGAGAASGAGASAGAGGAGAGAAAGAAAAGAGAAGAGAGAASAAAARAAASSVCAAGEDTAVGCCGAAVGSGAADATGGWRASEYRARFGTVEAEDAFLSFQLALERARTPAVFGCLQPHSAVLGCTRLYS